MTTLRDRLRDADPIRLAPARDGDRAIARARLLAAALADSDCDRRGAPEHRRAVLVIAVLTVVAALAGSRLWTRGGTTLHAAVRFEARLAESQPGTDLRAFPIVRKSDSTYLHQNVVVSNADIADARVIQGADADHFGVSVRFTADGARRMREATAEHLGRPIAILIDGEVVAAPMLRSAIDDIALISGDFTEQEAERIASGITPR